MKKHQIKKFQDKDYEYLVMLLKTNEKARKNNVYCCRLFFKDMYGVTTLEGLERKGVPNYQTILRKIRRAKAVDHSIPKVEKDQDKYKEISRDVVIMPMNLTQSPLF